MRYLAFILALHFSVFAAQPAWQAFSSLLPGGCSGETCVVVLAYANGNDAPACPVEDGKAKQSCCPPFQCCFPCCCFVNQPYQLDFQLLSKKKIRPEGRADLLNSQYVGECFHPPEMLFT